MAQEMENLQYRTPEQIAEAFDGQLAYTLSGEAAKDGSVAIALGRSAGLAKLLGHNSVARQLWSELNKQVSQTEGMPDIDQLFAGYEKNKDKFAQSLFASKDTFTAGGTAFSNAAGAYAFAIDYMQRGEEALVVTGHPDKIKAGDPDVIYSWGAQALRASGFEEQAKKMDNLRAKFIEAKAAQPDASKWTARTTQVDVSGPSNPRGV